MPKEKPPVSTGQTIEMDITDLNHNGEGVGRVDAFTVFVPLALPGDRVKAKVISVKKSYARALLEAVLNPSSHRIASLCRHFEDCGGCQLQHLDYGEQLRRKRQIVQDALRRLGGLDLEVLPVLGMSEPWSYRNKAQFPLGIEEKALKAGFFRRGTHEIIDLENCSIQHPLIDEAFGIARELIQELGMSIYDEKTHHGLLRHLVIRASHSGDQVLVILVTNGREFPQAKSFVEAITPRIPGLVGIVQNINNRRGNVVLGEENIMLWGKSYLVEKLGEISYLVSPGSFFQVNSAQAEVLFRQVEKYAVLTGSETVFDLYCGTGTIALYLSRKAGKVVGIESYSPAVEDARKNAQLNGITNAEFFTGPAEDIFPGLLEQGYSSDVVIVDPPRKGCTEKLLSTIAAANPNRFIYVSCNPSTLARDLRYLKEKGYSASEVQPVDMFPHTSHVECVVLMSRVTSK
ncbi:MAG: 23S rRNA (uracil(1939)-C(5))-methyltransferase RlmD [Bacillota bacterium]|nr:23S rRNA (uracil(1939)-C(5))-methyltransferase RlmD [Bacillota bacterium]